MSVPPKSERDVIPRWRSYTETSLTGELNPPAPKGARPWERRLERREHLAADWTQENSLSFAADLVGSAVILGPTREAVQAAEQLLASGATSRLAKSAARRVLEVSNSSADREQLSPEPVVITEHVRGLRRSLRKNIRNAVRWSELSRFYTIAGHEKRAKRAMQVAISLAPRDRYLVRCASRLEIHQGRSDRAIALLNGIAVENEDPWIVAAGLGAAGSAGQSSRLVRTGQRILSSGSYSAFDTSELASALGTLEAREGNDRLARRLFRKALEDPTDNSVAQAEWASRHVPGISIPADVLDRPESWEARAWTAAERSAHETAVKEAWHWHYDQPFASGPAEFGSYHASIDADFDSGAKIVLAALPSNKGEFMLLNNLAFCLASLDQPVEAARHLGEVRTPDLSAAQRATYLATRGLIAFRLGRIDEGRHLYRRSIETWHDPTNQALALIMLAREELRTHSPDAPILEAEARNATERASGNDLQAWIKHLDFGQRGYRRWIKRSNDPKDQ